jgi:hypothetical protein
MSVTRRQFLLSTAGASVGAIVPSFYFRALEFFEQHESPLLISPERVTQDLVVVNFNGYPELCLGDPYAEPPKMTFREYFTRYEPEGFEYFESHWGLEPGDLDSEIDEEYVMDSWLLQHGPSAQAYHYLDSLDLGPVLRGRDGVGGLDFMEESNMVSTWLAVSPRDQVTLSLLQQRLNDLGTGIRIVR